MADTLAVVANTLLGCVSDALSDDLRPVCKVYQTHGTPVIFQCCECDDDEIEGANGEISIHFRRLFDADPSTLDEVRRIRPCKGGVTAAQFRLVLARCRPIINEHGEIPPPEVLTAHTEDQLRDIELLWQSLACCSGMDLRIDDVSADLSDPGTCSVIYADVTVQVRVPPLPEPEPALPYRTVALGAPISYQSGDPRFSFSGSVAVLDDDGPLTFVAVGGMSATPVATYGEVNEYEYTTLTRVTANDESTIPGGVGDYVFISSNNVDVIVADTISQLAAIGVTAVPVASGIIFDPESPSQPFTVGP